MINCDFEKFRGRTPGLIVQETCKSSAVVIPVIDTPNGPEILFEVRSDRIGRQPGDICFPGGRMKEGESPKEAAVRETCEELLVSPDQVEVIFENDTFYNTSVLIYPFVSYLRNYKGSFSKDEVEEVFTVPVSHFMENDPFICSSKLVRVVDDNFPYRMIHGGRDYRWPERIDNELFYFIGDRAIWGITARILNAFLKLLKES